MRLESREFDSRPPHCPITTLDKLFTHMCLCHRDVLIATGQKVVTPYSWEGNRRSSVAVTTRFIHPWLIGLEKEDKHYFIFHYKFAVEYEREIIF